MKIYNRIFLVLAASAAMVACRTEQPIEFGVDTTEIAIGPDGGVRTVKVAASQKWVATLKIFYYISSYSLSSLFHNFTTTNIL